MSTPWNGDDLARRQPVVVVLRLVLDQDGSLSYGEVLDAAGSPHGRFTSWDGLVQLLRAWLEQERPNQDQGPADQR